MCSLSPDEDDRLAVWNRSEPEAGFEQWQLPAELKVDATPIVFTAMLNQKNVVCIMGNRQTAV